MKRSYLKNLIRQVLKENYSVISEDSRYDAEVTMTEFQEVLNKLNDHVDQLSDLSENLKSLMGDYYGVDERVTKDVRKIVRAIDNLNDARERLGNRRMGIFNPSGLETGFRD